MLTVNKFIKEGKKVDYIFGDLTDIPISDSACGELWEFMITILEAAFKILKPTGKFMTHVSRFYFTNLTIMYWLSSQPYLTQIIDNAVYMFSVMQNKNKTLNVFKFCEPDNLGKIYINHN